MVFLAHPARLVHHLPWFSGPPCRAGAPLAVVFWPTLLGRCPTCRGFLGPPCWAGAPPAMVFLAHPARLVYHLQWFSGPPCWAGAPLAVVFLAHPAGLVHYLPWVSGSPCQAGAPLATVFWLTLLGRCTTCHSLLAHLAGPASAPLAMVFLAHPAGPVYQLLWLF